MDPNCISVTAVGPVSARQSTEHCGFHLATSLQKFQKTLKMAEQRQTEIGRCEEAQITKARHRGAHPVCGYSHLRLVRAARGQLPLVPVR